jgi:catalase (peroxidase I)
MEIAVSGHHRLAPQWLRLSFHDAGTFNKAVPEGGANGCLMNFPDMRRQEENRHLHLAINTLEKIRDHWEQLENACIDISSADIIQFAGFFASVRQTGSVPGITSAKIIELLGFKWGRPDETNCKTKWTQNLPGFMLGTDENDIPLRCNVAGKEIKTKMMDRNGFTSEEATALIGAHTIGLTRNVFGDKAAPWVVNGADNATPTGPVFDNSYFVLMEQNIPALSTAEFDSNTAPFKEVFPDWFQTASSTPLNFLDTDLVLAFPPKSSSDHPDYHAHTVVFTNNNQLFLTTFRKALVKMGSLGVTGVLTVPGPCSSCQAFTPVTVRSLLKLVSNLGEATSTAEFLLAAEQEANKDQLLAQTTVIRITS